MQRYGNKPISHERYWVSVESYPGVSVSMAADGMSTKYLQQEKEMETGEVYRVTAV